MKPSKHICIIGLGYIGLPTAALLASKGYRVTGVDINPDTVQIINRGEIHIVEPDLDAFVRSAVSSGRLVAQTMPIEADVFIVCVPTPLHEYREEIPQPDISYVEAAFKSIAPVLKSNNMVILESTCPVGTTEKMAHLLEQMGINLFQVDIAYCPERVLPGKIMTELLENDRVVGGLDFGATQRISQFYKTFVRGDVLETDAKTAEMCKLAENSFRDVNIAYANELSLLCARNHINVNKLIELANRHPRVNILTPGVGVGGHCIAVDPWFLIADDPSKTPLMQSARRVNNYKTQWIVENIQHNIERLKKGSGQLVRVACYGITFKPDIDDLRESPALSIVESLSKEAIDLMVIEPNIPEYPKFILWDAKDAYERADLAVFLVKHRQFIEIFQGIDTESTLVLDYCGLLCE